jgi:hypothetical protein
MRHVLVCTTEYSDHRAGTIARKRAQADAMSYEKLGAANAAEFVEKQILQGQPLTKFLMRSAPRPLSAVPAHVVALE